MSTEALLAVARLDEAGFLKLKEGQCLVDVALIIDLAIDIWSFCD